MPPVRIKWSSLLNLTELEFEPEPPKQLSVSDELIQSLSWLTAATKHDRKFLRCDENGALLTTDAWALLNAVDEDELYPESASPKTSKTFATNKGVLIATSSVIIMIDFYQIADTVKERIYLPANCLYFYPHKTAKVIIATVPYTGGEASYVGVTAFN